jgi:hypothetical protein
MTNAARRQRGVFISAKLGRVRWPHAPCNVGAMLLLDDADVILAL